MISKRNILISTLVSLITIFISFVVLIYPVKTFNVLTFGLVVILLLFGAFMLYKVYLTRDNFKLDLNLVLGIAFIIIASILIFNSKVKESFISSAIIILIISNGLYHFKNIDSLEFEHRLVPYTGIAMMIALGLFLLLNLLFKFIPLNLALGAILAIYGSVNLLVTLSFYKKTDIKLVETKEIEDAS